MSTQSNQFSIKPMVEADITSLMTIENECFPYLNLRSENIFMQDTKNGTGYTLRMDDSIAGYISFSIESNILKINKMGVGRKYRGLGGGKLMIRWVKDLAKSHNCTKIFLHVRENNGSAVGLYESMGFEKIKRKEGYYERTGGETALAMELNLVED